MNIDHVFAKGNVIAGPEYGDRMIPGGSCWPADDPLVRKRPELFTADPRFAFGRDQSWSGEPPAYMSEPPEDEAPVRGRPRSRTLVSSHGTGGPA